MSARRILHVDMDAFYASVEERERPQLKGSPVVVGGTPEGRGVVCAANYEARRFGVHSAMPAARARRLCPHAHFIKPRMAFYAEVSHELRDILRSFTPEVETLALDEAFMDVTASERLFGPAPEVAVAVRAAIREELELAASVGVASNKFLAKLACSLSKPDGLLVVEEDSVQAFLDPLPVTRLWGVGDAARAALEREGIHRVADLRAMPRTHLQELFGRWGDRLADLARGHDEREVVSEARARSLSHETTFSRDIEDPSVLRAWTFDLAEQVARRARTLSMRGRTVRLKLRYGDFRTVTRAHSLEQPVNDTRCIAATAWSMLKRELKRSPGAMRLLGVGLAGFQQWDLAQPDLFADQPVTDDPGLDAVADRINDRFGGRAVSRARALGKES